MKLFRRLVIVFLLVYGGVVAFVAARQDRFLYQPVTESQESLLKLARGAGFSAVRTGTGEIAGWHLPNPGAPRRLLVFHGGAGHALNRVYYAEGFHRLGWDVHLFEYPGFGSRPGVPGKASFIAAASAFVQERLAEDSRPCFLLGESMGSGTVCAVAGNLGERIAGVALMVPYARLEEVAQHHLPYLPIGLILRDKYDNIAALAAYRGPLAVVIADCDEVVTPEQGRKLYASYAGPKHLITLRDCKHAGFAIEPGAEWWREVNRFLAFREGAVERNEARLTD